MALTLYFGTKDREIEKIILVLRRIEVATLLHEGKYVFEDPKRGVMYKILLDP
jgi:hypothetical protein